MAEPADGRRVRWPIGWPSIRQPVARPAVVREDRLELLARWFGARTLVVEDGRALVVERQLPLPAERQPRGWRSVRRRPTSTPKRPACRPARARSSSWPASAPVRGDTMVVRQYLLPDYPFERPLLRALAADLAGCRSAGDLQRPHLRHADAGRAPHLPRPLPGAGRLSLMPTTTCCRRRGGCSGGRSAARGWRTSRRGVLGVRREVDCPGSEVPARYFGYLQRRLAGHPGRGARPQPPGRRQPGAARSGAGAAAGRRVARRGGPRSPRDGAGPAARRRRRRCAGAGRVGPGDRRRSGGSERAAAGRLAPAAWRPARSSARRSCGGSARGGRRWMPPPPGSRWRASASGTATTWPARWPPPPRPRGSWTWRSRWGGVAAWMPSAAPGCASSAVSGACGAGWPPPNVAPREPHASPEQATSHAGRRRAPPAAKHLRHPVHGRSSGRFEIGAPRAGQGQQHECGEHVAARRWSRHPPPAAPAPGGADPSRRPARDRPRRRSPPAAGGHRGSCAGPASAPGRSAPSARRSSLLADDQVQRAERRHQPGVHGGRRAATGRLALRGAAQPALQDRATNRAATERERRCGRLHRPPARTGRRADGSAVAGGNAVRLAARAPAPGRPRSRRDRR